MDKILKKLISKINKNNKIYVILIILSVLLNTKLLYDKYSILDSGARNFLSIFLDVSTRIEEVSPENLKNNYIELYFMERDLFSAEAVINFKMRRDKYGSLRCDCGLNDCRNVVDLYSLTDCFASFIDTSHDLIGEDEYYRKAYEDYQNLFYDLKIYYYSLGSDKSRYNEYLLLKKYLKSKKIFVRNNDLTLH